MFRLCSVVCGSSTSGTQGTYTTPFTVKDVPGVYTGPRYYELDYWSVDAVGNQNATPNRLTFYVDDVPPSLDPFGAQPDGRFVNASVVDDRSGVDRVVVWWSLNGQPFTPTALDFVDGVWETVLPEGQKGDHVEYYLEAWDRVGNSAIFRQDANTNWSYNGATHPPFIKITSPVDGSTIARQVVLTWQASSLDNLPLTFRVLYRAPGKTGFAELAKLESSDARSYVLDTTQFQDGQYTFRVEASDGSYAPTSDVTVTILNTANPIASVSPLPESVQPGQGVCITAQITKANAIVEARIYRDGQFVNSYPMNDDGQNCDKTANDGIYSVRVAFDTPGHYSVEIYTRYQEDGQLKETSLPNAASFGVNLTPTAIFTQYGLLIVIAGLLAVAGIGVAAYVLIRRR
jgi:hypothetical protein